MICVVVAWRNGKVHKHWLFEGKNADQDAEQFVASLSPALTARYEYRILELDKHPNWIG
jgi:hypothetical protein